jgi:hypothetical protein
LHLKSKILNQDITFEDQELKPGARVERNQALAS